MQLSKHSRIAKVLAIDDNAGILFCLRQALTIKGYEVRTTESFEGIEAVQGFSPDLIFLDISLAGKDGREIARELKGDVRTRHIPIVIVTAYPDADELAKAAGADGYLSKPFELIELWKTAAKHLKGASSANEPEALTGRNLAAVASRA